MSDTPEPKRLLADDAANHPYFGPCDANAPDGRCFECAKLRQPLDENEVLAYLRKRRGNDFLLAALQLLEERTAAERTLTMRADCADWAAAELEIENKTLLNAIEGRELEVKAALQGLLAPYLNQDGVTPETLQSMRRANASTCLSNRRIMRAAAELNITLD